jgi:hypothetical protein
VALVLQRFAVSGLALEACERQDIYWSKEFSWWLSAPEKKWNIFPLKMRRAKERVRSSAAVG